MASSSRTLARLAGQQFGATAQRLHPSLLPVSPSAAAQAVARFGTTSCARKPALPAAAAPSSSPSPSALLAASTFSRQFQRHYADAAAPPPKKKPGKIRRTFRWARRLTYLTILGLVGAVAYDGYKDRYPEEQFAPDPNKKTLVVLGA